MLIIYDGCSLDPRWRHYGVGEVLSNLIKRLKHQYDLVGLAPQFPQPVPETMCFSKSLSRKLDFLLFDVSPHMVSGFDLYWGPNNSLPMTVRKPSVVTVHDLLLFRYPSDQPWSRIVRPRFVSAIRRATRIVAVSRTTADDLTAAFPEAASKIEVIHNGFSLDETNGAAEYAQFESPYALFMGAHRPRKNLPLAIAAVAKARETNPHLRLLVTGGVHPQFQPLVDRSRDFVLCTGTLSRPQLVHALKHAVALLFPSLYEGFGLPLLEAMSAGCPVIALDTPINREIGGDALCCLPALPNDWSRELLRLTTNNDWRSDLSQRGFANLKRFSWDRAANEYGAVFADLLT